MTTTVSLVAEDDGTFAVESDGNRLASALDEFDQALKITSLVIRAEFGDDQSAAAELDRLGVEPPALEPDDEPLPA